MLTRWNVRQLSALFVLFMMTLNPSTAFALDDGGYEAVFKTTYVEENNYREKLGHEGKAVFHIRDDAILDIEIEGFSFGDFTYDIEIDNETGVIRGVITEKERPFVEGASHDIRWNIKGVFVDNAFAGEVTTYVTAMQNKGEPETNLQPPFWKWASYVFESP